MNAPNDAILIGEFHQGQAAADRDGFRSDCPHRPGTERHAAWMAGFEQEDGDTRWTLAVCGTRCEHEWAGWRETEGGGEQFCQKCGAGAMAASMWEDD